MIMCDLDALLLHVSHDALVVLVSGNASVELVEDTSQLHSNHETRHAQDNVAPHLPEEIKSIKYTYSCCTYLKMSGIVLASCNKGNKSFNLSY